jgi:putative transposase
MRGFSPGMSKLAPQEIRTFFVSTRTNLSQPLFRKRENAELLLDVFRKNREQSRLELHAFVVMYDHLHLLLTPAPEHSLEKCVQFIKGGFSFRIKKELGHKWNVWQESFNEHRVKDASDYDAHVQYIHQNPVRARYVQSPEEYRFSSACLKHDVDPTPQQFRG